MRARRELPSQERLKELFDYDPATGVLRARLGKNTRRGSYKAGDALGYPDAFGYLKVTVDGFPYFVHRVAWKWVTGEEPSSFIDHRNRVRHDNSWANLRLADRYANAANVATRKPAGWKGVYPAKSAGKWRATLTHRGETHYLGTFETEGSAREAYLRKAEELRGQPDETPYVPTIVDVLTLTDEELMDAALDAVGALRGIARDQPEQAPRLRRIADRLAANMARVAPATHGFMAPGPLSEFYIKPDNLS